MVSREPSAIKPMKTARRKLSVTKTKGAIQKSTAAVPKGAAKCHTRASVPKKTETGASNTQGRSSTVRGLSNSPIPKKPVTDRRRTVPVVPPPTLRGGAPPHKKPHKQAPAPATAPPAKHMSSKRTARGPVQGLAAKRHNAAPHAIAPPGVSSDTCQNKMANSRRRDPRRQPHTVKEQKSPDEEAPGLRVHFKNAKAVYRLVLKEEAPNDAAARAFVVEYVSKKTLPWAIRYGLNILRELEPDSYRLLLRRFPKELDCSE